MTCKAPCSRSFSQNRELRFRRFSVRWGRNTANSLPLLAQAGLWKYVAPVLQVFRENRHRKVQEKGMIEWYTCALRSLKYLHLKKCVIQTQRQLFSSAQLNMHLDWTCRSSKKEENSFISPLCYIQKKMQLQVNNYHNYPDLRWGVEAPWRRWGGPWFLFSFFKLRFFLVWSAVS